jgi:hypothetical protein
MILAIVLASARSARWVAATRRIADRNLCVAINLDRLLTGRRRSAQGGRFPPTYARLGS